MKRLNNYLILFLIILFIHNGCSRKLPVQAIDTSSLRFEVPEVIDGEEVIEHFAITLSYNDQHKNANWVVYLLTRERLNGQFSRNERFFVDPKISASSSKNRDFRKSGYDRGHLAPAADFSWSEIAMKESFYFSNISPQLPGFNRGIWKRLENLCRTWASEYDSIYIVTGPVLVDTLPSIGNKKVSVPEYFYKVILNYTASRKEGIGFIMRNQSSTDNLQVFAVSIDSVEKFAGINSFPLLPDDLENRLEGMKDVGNWVW